MLAPLPTDRPVLAWYGDDFTGSGAVMEVLTFAGIPAVLFLEPPTPAMLAHFPNARAIGLASDARTRSPEGMRAELPRAFARLRSSGVTHSGGTSKISLAVRAWMSSPLRKASISAGSPEKWAISRSSICE